MPADPSHFERDHAHTIDAMASPSSERIVKVDRQGRAVIPQELREGLVTPPGEVIAVRTQEGVLLRAMPESPGTVATADDGLPVLRLQRPVTNDEVLSALDADSSYLLDH